MFKQVGIVGHCLILSQAIGDDPITGEEIPSFFAAFMLTKDGKPGCSLAEAADVVRISRNRNTCADLIGFCQGYSAAIQHHGRSGLATGWEFKGPIDPATITVPTVQERDRLRAWPERE